MRSTLGQKSLTVTKALAYYAGSLSGEQKKVLSNCSNFKFQVQKIDSIFIFNYFMNILNPKF